MFIYNKKITSIGVIILLLVSTVSTTFVASGFLPYAELLASKGYISKQSSEYGYHLKDFASRQEVAGTAIKILGSTLSENYKCKGYFTDVSLTSPASWSCRAIEVAADEGIISRSNSEYRPKDNITRAEALSMILKSVNILISTGSTSSFSDTSITWHKNVANTALSKNIISKNTNFRPNDNVTRGELFVFASNALGLKTIPTDSKISLSDSSLIKSNESPFGLMEVKLFQITQLEAIKDLGVKSARLAPDNNIIWDKVEKTKGTYDWSGPDGIITTAYKEGIKTFITIGPGGEGRKGGPAKLPNDADLEWFLEFLGKAAERYDGDSIDDAPGSPKIDVIQIYNEVDGPGFWSDTPENYALLLKKSYKVVKKVSPNMKVAIAGEATPNFNKFYKQIFTELNRIKDNSSDQYFDIFDFHWSGQFPGTYSTINLPDGTYDMKKYILDVKTELSNIGYKNVPIYITEISDYSGSPSSSSTNPIKYEFHSEKAHASSLIKRYNYAFVAGANKIYWNQIIEQNSYGGEVNGYFDNVGIINNPRNDSESHNKLAYYSYKKMLEILDGSDWNNIEKIGESDGIYIYKYTKGGKPIWVLWNDNTDSKSVSLDISSLKSVNISESIPKCESGKDINDYDSAFKTETKTAQNGKINVTLDDVPLFVGEAINLAKISSTSSNICSTTSSSSSSSQPVTTTNTIPTSVGGKCGDNVCDVFEKANPNICPSDCK